MSSTHVALPALTSSCIGQSSARSRPKPRGPALRAWRGAWPRLGRGCEHRCRRAAAPARARGGSGSGEFRQSLTVVLTAADQVSGAPSGVADQSLDRISAPSSPPPSTMCGLLPGRFGCCCGHARASDAFDRQLRHHRSRPSRPFPDRVAPDRPHARQGATFPRFRWLLPALTRNESMAPMEPAASSGSSWHCRGSEGVVLLWRVKPSVDLPWRQWAVPVGSWFSPRSA